MMFSHLVGEVLVSGHCVGDAEARRRRRLPRESLWHKLSEEVVVIGLQLFEIGFGIAL
jgi:hypothetical protein